MRALQRTAGLDYQPTMNYRPHIEVGFAPRVSTALAWAKILRRKWLIVVLSPLFFAVFAAIIILLPVSYTATSEIVVEQRPQGVDIAAVLSRMPTDSQAILTEAESLRSRELVRRTLYQLNLLNNPEFNPLIIPQDGSLRATWRTAKAEVTAFVQSLLPKRGAPNPGDPVLNEATEIFLKQLRVTPIGRSQVLKATFTSENPQLASEILNTLVGLYLTSQIENRVAVPSKVGEFMKGELERLQAKVRASNDAVEQFRNQAQLQQGIAQGRETLLYTQELSDLNRELVAVRVKKQDAEARLAEIEANPNSFSNVLASPVIQQLHKQQSLLREQLSQLAATHGRAHPTVRELESSIADGDRRIAAEVAKVVSSLRSDVAVNTEREIQLSKSVAEAKEQIKGAGAARVTLASLEQEAEVNRTILTTFLTQYNQLTSQRALQVADSFVLARASIPTQPSFPPLIPFLGLAAVMSVGLAVLSALLLERTGKTIRSSHEVEPLLTAPSLAVVPALGARSTLATQVIDSPQSQYTEAIRSILSRFMAPREVGRVIVLTSAQRREGRTSLAVSLARLAAISGRRVVLVDCDLRNPAVHQSLRTEMGEGLTDLLQNRLDARRVIRKDAITSLDYITAGSPAAHAVNLLALTEMPDLLEQLRASYDIVILDSPPSAAVADATFITQMADECLFVVRWNKTPWRLAREQMSELARYCSFAGVILNQVDMRRHIRYNPRHTSSHGSSVLIGPAG